MEEIIKRFTNDKPFEAKVLKHAWNVCPVTNCKFEEYFEPLRDDDTIRDYDILEKWSGMLTLSTQHTRDGYENYVNSVIKRFQEGVIKKPLHVLTHCGIYRVNTIKEDGAYYCKIMPENWGAGFLTISKQELLFIFKSTLNQVHKDNFISNTEDEAPEEFTCEDLYSFIQTQTEKLNTTTKETNMSTVQELKNSAEVSLKLAARMAKGRTALATIHSLVTKLLPIKWGFMARLTGKDKQITNHPLTKLAEAAVANALVRQFTNKYEIISVTQAAQDVAMLEVAKLIPIEDFIEELTDKIGVKLDTTKESTK